MPGIRALIGKKEKRQIEELSSRLIRHRQLILTRTLLVLIFGAAVILAVYTSYQNKVYVDYDIVKTIERTDTEKVFFLPYSRNILKYSQDGVTALDTNNNMIWSVTYQMQNPMIAVCGDYVAVGDAKGNEILVIDGTGQQRAIATTIPVTNLDVSAQGIVAAVLEDKKETYIKIYNAAGEEAAGLKTTLSQTGYPIAVSLSDDSIKLAVSYLQIDGNELKSSVAFYNFGDVGQNVSEHLVSSYEYTGTLIPKLEFVGSSTALAIGDNKVCIYKGAQKPVSIFTLDTEEEIQSVYKNSRNFALVYRSGGEEGDYRIDVYDYSGNLVISQHTDIEYTDIVLHKDLIIVYSDKIFSIYSMKGIEKFTGTFDKLISMVVPTNRKTRYILLSKGSMEVIQLQ